jgi:hypothetical protein
VPDDTDGTADVFVRRSAVEEGEIDRSPMLNMAPPTLGEKPVPVLTDDELRLPGHPVSRGSPACWMGLMRFEQVGMVLGAVGIALA